MQSSHDEELDSLIWNWGEAYVVTNPKPDIWLAVRRDDHATLRADDPDTLREMIWKDYSARPVKR